ncbi:MAG TPA: DNA polymerase I [Terriglobales bacterium]|nr:DNA polymerase I [Terriglobales bacterium]
MPRLFVLDAMGLAYRAYYAFVMHPLTRSLVVAREPGTVRLEGIELYQRSGPPMTRAAGGSVVIVDAEGRERQRESVPANVLLMVENGRRITAEDVRNKRALLGENTSAIFGFANTVLKIRREEKPDHWALAWDGPGPTWRHERFPDYKAQRKPMPEDLLAQLEPIEVLAQALGLPVLEIPGMEADDVMGALARRGVRDGFEVALVTGDKDMLQCVGTQVRVLLPQTRDEYLWLDEEGVRARWGVGPEHIRDVLALMGDSTDNIPGVPGIGEKTAKELLLEFGSLEELYARLDEVKKPALKAKLETNRELAFLSRELATVRTDLDVPYTWDDLRCAPIRREALTAFARRWEIRRLEHVAQSEGVADGDAGSLSPSRAPDRRGTASETPAEGVKLGAPHTPKGAIPVPPPTSSAPPASPSPAAAPAQAPPSAATCAPSPAVAPAQAPPPAPTQSTLDLWSSVEIAEAGGESALLESWVRELHEVRARALHGLALLPLTTGPDARRGKLVGLALAARDGTACYLPLAHDSGPNLALAQVRGWIALALDDPTVPKLGHDLKSDLHALAGAGLQLDGLAFDARVASFLCDPMRDHSLAALARDFLGEALPPLEPPAPRGRPRSEISALTPMAARGAAMAGARALLGLEPALRAQLESRQQWPLYEQLEHPLIPVLYEMERTGIAIDRAVLAEMSERAAAEVARLEEALYVLADERLNLNSGPQIARVLFEKLGLKTGRRTKTGYSTDQAVLEELAASHPFPRLLLEYRALTKLKSTYLDALPAEAMQPASGGRPDGRVHTTFHQTGAATGRLSSSDPNLQNIPFRSPQGRAIRRAFVAPSGRMLVGADYSQIELRVMAHLSGDPALAEAFASGEDVHASTARRIFGVPTGDLDPALRARAKIVNFGVMYGMGARSLAQQMSIPLDEAEAFIRDYFRVYARVRDYLDRTLDEARRNGWVQTLLGRRRYLPDLTHPNGAQRSLAERAAINTPIQGSAADLMKLAMIRVHAALKRQHPSARLLLQVHDELLLECPAADAEAVAALTRAEMQSCFPLRVPLVATAGHGASWFDVH